MQKDDIQGDPKLVPPIPGRNEMCILKTDNGTFKYNLFDTYLENFVMCPPTEKDRWNHQSNKLALAAS